LCRDPITPPAVNRQVAYRFSSRPSPNNAGHATLRGELPVVHRGPPEAEGCGRGPSAPDRVQEARPRAATGLPMPGAREAGSPSRLFPLSLTHSSRLHAPEALAHASNSRRARHTDAELVGVPHQREPLDVSGSGRGDDPALRSGWGKGRRARQILDNLATSGRPGCQHPVLPFARPMRTRPVTRTRHPAPSASAAGTSRIRHPCCLRPEGLARPPQWVHHTSCSAGARADRAARTSRALAGPYAGPCARHSGSTSYRTGPACAAGGRPLPPIASPRAEPRPLPSHDE
jgi:hypothetical protein